MARLLYGTGMRLMEGLRLQMLAARALWEADRQAQRGGVEMPHALDIKYAKVGSTWAWFWMFPSPTLSIDPRSGVERRHHSATMIYTHVLKAAAGGTASPLDSIGFGP